MEAVASTREALDKLAAGQYPIVVCDIYIDDHTGIDILNAAKASNPRCDVILMSARGSMETVMAATRGGAFDYLAKPFEIDDLLDPAARRKRRSPAMTRRSRPIEDPLPSGMIGSSAKMVDIYKTVSRVAPTDALVLIEGETGTGKELIARMLHRNSLRSAHAVRAGRLRFAAPPRSSKANCSAR